MLSTIPRVKWAPLNREEGEVHLVAEVSNISHMTYGRTTQLGRDASSLISTFDCYFNGTKSGLASLVRGGDRCNVVFAVQIYTSHKGCTPVCIAQQQHVGSIVVQDGVHAHAKLVFLEDIV